MNCPSCGKPNADSEKFCGHCGTNLSTTVVAVPTPSVSSATSIDPKIVIGAVVLVAIIVLFFLMSSSPSGLSGPVGPSGDPFASAKLAVIDFDTCYNKLDNALVTSDYPLMMTTSIECKQYANEYSLELDKIYESSLTAEQKEELRARKLHPYIMTNLMDAFYHLGKGLKASEIEDYETYGTEFESFLASIDEAVYNIYRMKVEYPDYYQDQIVTDGMSEVEFFAALQQLYQLGNEYSSGLSDDAYYTYFYQVDATDSAVVYVTDTLVADLMTEDERSLALLQFVRENIKYNFDPSWYQDWPMPPAYTLLSGRGDCDDMSILLISMLNRAGVSNAELCLADGTAPYDDGYDHMTVGLNAGDGWYILEPTCATCEDIAPDDVGLWTIDCAGVEDYLLGTNPSEVPEETPEITIKEAIEQGYPVACTTEQEDGGWNLNLYFEAPKYAVDNWEKGYEWIIYDGSKWYQTFRTDENSDARKWFDITDDPEEQRFTYMQYYNAAENKVNDGEIHMECAIYETITPETFIPE